MDIQLAPITPADGRAIVDLFNHYVVHSFAAFPEDSLPYPFFDRLIEAARNLPTVTARTADGRLLGFALLRPHSPWPTGMRTCGVSRPANASSSSTSPRST